MAKFAQINDVLVILKDHDSDVGADEYGDFDLSKKWITIEYADAEPQYCKITLNAKNGRYLTRTPKIKKRDRIFVSITDKNGNVTADVFHVRRIKRKDKPGVGLTLEITCPHQQRIIGTRPYHLKKEESESQETRQLIL